MLTLYYWTTPNGHKITIFLEEAGLDYQLVPIDIGSGAQFAEDFLKIAPNNRIPALVDEAPADGGGPISVFESGAILIYLAEKTGRFIATDPRLRVQTMEWLMWQMGGLGPMLGQNHHFRLYAPEPLPYAVERYTNEALRLYRVLNRRLAGRDYICDDYGIADMACYPWCVGHAKQGIELDELGAVADWMGRIAERPAVQRAYAKGAEINTAPTVSGAARSVLFGQTDTRAPDKS